MKRAFVTGGSGFLGGAMIPAFIARGIEVVGLARSESAAAKVRALGATAVIDELVHSPTVVDAMRGCDAVFHAAAIAKEHGKLAEFRIANVDGTRAMLDAAKAAGVPTFVHVSTEAVLVAGDPLHRVDETAPYPEHPAGPYPITKGEAERVAVAAGAVVIRPRFIWGKGDTSLLPNLLVGVKNGRFKWIGGGHYPTSTCHVQNVITGALAAAERGTPGEIYFLTDGEPVDFRDFLTKMFATQGVAADTIGSVPRWLAKTLASLTSWMAHPPVTKFAIGVVGNEVTVSDAKARRDLGYTPTITIEAGLRDMQV